ncbi:MAG TPA: hypothetical protein VGB14_06160 [Acidimicrobiales bacterium]|jgi:hypothetical protein
MSYFHHLLSLLSRKADGAVHLHYTYGTPERFLVSWWAGGEFHRVSGERLHQTLSEAVREARADQPEQAA